MSSIITLKHLKTSSSSPGVVLGTLLLIMMIVSGLVACGRDKTPRIPPNVVIITMDTMRADHLGCYGYERPTSPRIDEFARSAVFYPRSIASSPWTIPSHASLFTGMVDEVHGVVSPDLALPAGVGTLAERLALQGWATGAIVNAGRDTD